MLKVGPNPYGLCCTLGLQGSAPHPKDIDWFLSLAEEMRGRCIEFHGQHLIDLGESKLTEIRLRLNESGIEPIISGPWPLSRIHLAIPIARLLGVQVVRTHLSPILCGARAEQGAGWKALVADIRVRLAELGPKFVDNGLVLAVENHQDFGSEELMEFCEVGGDGIGITLDTGNPLAVAEDPVRFATTVAGKVRHVHLKDYRTFATPEGYRLVRCAIGEGCIPFPAIAEILTSGRGELTATLEPGALDSRHIKLLTAEWWDGYPPRSESDKSAPMAYASIRPIPAEECHLTPWEQGASAETVCEFEIDQMNRSVHYMKSLGWLPA